MKPQIIHKLDKVLTSFGTEVEVVYILTRIGKILEIDQKKKTFPILNFYRNWAVHSELDDNKFKFNRAMRDQLENFIKDSENRDNFLFHKELTDQLQNFLKQYALPQLTYEQIDLFIFLLSQVISDTPIILIMGNSEYKVELAEPKAIGWSGVYKISVNVPVNTLHI